MWVILVTYKNKQANVSQEAYKTYLEARQEIMKKENIKAITNYIYYDIDNEIQYELKNVYIK